MVLNAPPLPRLPDPTGVDVTNPDDLRNYLALLTASLSKHLAQRTPQAVPTNEQLFRSPNGSVYKLTVSDGGAATMQPFGSAEGKPLPP